MKIEPNTIKADERGNIIYFFNQSVSGKDLKKISKKLMKKHKL